MTAKCPYTVLGIHKSASENDIKKAYRGLAKKYHPDKNENENAEEKFKEIGAAYDLLKDPVKKIDHDNKREAEEEKAKRAKENAKNNFHTNFTSTSNTKPSNGFSSFKTGDNGTSFSFSSNGSNFTFKTTFNSFDNKAKKDNNNNKKGKSTNQSKPRKPEPQPEPKHQRRTFNFTRPSWNSNFTEDSDDEDIGMHNSKSTPNFRFSFGGLPTFDDDPFNMDDMFASFFDQASFFSGMHRDFLRINTNGASRRAKKPAKPAMEDMWDWGNPLFGAKKHHDYEDDEFSYSSDPEVDISDGLLPCSYCGRSFKADYVKKHEEVCRRIFGGHKQHTSNIPNGRSKRKTTPIDSEGEDDDLAPPPPRSHDWRREHEDLQRNIRHARAHARRHASPEHASSQNFVKCTYCGRKFSALVAELHVPTCAERVRTCGEPMNPAGASTARDHGSKNERAKEYAKHVPKPKASHHMPFRGSTPNSDDTPSSTPRATPYTRPAPSNAHRAGHAHTSSTSHSTANPSSRPAPSPSHRAGHASSTNHSTANATSRPTPSKTGASHRTSHAPNNTSHAHTSSGRRGGSAKSVPGGGISGSGYASSTPLRTGSYTAGSESYPRASPRYTASFHLPTPSHSSASFYIPSSSSRHYAGGNARTTYI